MIYVKAMAPFGRPHFIAAMARRVELRSIRSSLLTSTVLHSLPHTLHGGLLLFLNPGGLTD